MGRVYVGRFKEGKLKHRVLLLVLRLRLNKVQLLCRFFFTRDLWKWSKKEVIVVMTWFVCLLCTTLWKDYATET